MDGIVGYRGWAVKDGHLAPPHYKSKSPWRPRGFAVAHCSSRHHQAAGDQCRCGLYAHYSITHAMKKENSPKVDVMGAILGWGPTSHHDSGFRCGKARIIGLTTAASLKEAYPRQKMRTRDEREAIAREIAALYEVPFFPKTKELRIEAERWGEKRRPRPIRASSMGIAEFARAFEGRALSLPKRGEKPLRFVRLARSRPSGPRCIRLVVELEINPRVAIEEEMDFQRNERCLRVEGIKGNLWDLLDATIEITPEYVPMPGTTQVAFKPGYRKCVLKLVGDFTYEQASHELYFLDRNIGRILNYQEIRQPEINYEVPRGSLPHPW